MASKFRSSQYSAWMIPLIYAAAAILVGSIVPRLGNYYFPNFTSSISVDAAIGIYSSVASGMIALTGIVFSLTFVMVQFSATAYSPRLVLWIARDPVISHAIGVFTATFLYALYALAWVDRSASGRVPLINLQIVTFLLVVCVLMFISLIQRVGMLQVTRMLIFTGNQGRHIIANLYRPIDSLPSPRTAEVPSIPCAQTLYHHGDPRVVQSIDISRLVQTARANGSIIEVMVAVGDTVHDSTPIVQIFGTGFLLSGKTVLEAIELGRERTFEQDPKYAIRLLVDIAIKALSPAINDPTTAVQALDQIEDLLLRLGRRRLEIGAFRDDTGQLRLLGHFPSWEDFLRLAFDEIRFYGSTSVQVMRRMKALMSELISVLPEERRPALHYWRERLQSTVERSFADVHDKIDASVEDRQGLGSARRESQAT